MGGNRARYGAPDQGCHLSPTRTRHRISTSITIALAGSAIAVAGIASGAPAGRAGPASTGRAVPGSATTLVLAARPALQTARSLSHRAPSERLTPRQIARTLLRHRFHWKAWQFKYLDSLWATESGWNPYASNPYSGAYGIPQAVPGSKMASAGPGWRWNARTQILWGLHYIKARYRTPYWAWLHQRVTGWY